MFTLPTKEFLDNKNRNDMEEKKLNTFLMLSKLHENKWEQKELKETFQKLSLSSKLFCFNLFSLVNKQKLVKLKKMNDMIFPAITEATQKMLRANNEPNQVLKSARSVQDKSSSCYRMNSNEDKYGIFSLLKDFVVEIISLVMAGIGIISILSFILILRHFDVEILQYDYSQIHGMNLFQSVILMIIIVAASILLNGAFGYKKLRENMTGLQKVLFLVPFIPEALTFYKKITLCWSKFQTQKQIFLYYGEKDTNWDSVKKAVRIDNQIQQLLEEIDSGNKLSKAFSAVLRNISISILSLLVIINNNTLMMNTVTKNIPYTLQVFSLLSFVFVAKDLWNHKNNNRLSTISFGAFLFILGLLTTILPKALLTALLGLHIPPLIMVPIIVGCGINYLLNQTSNNGFKLLSIGEKLMYSSIASVVPVTIKGPPLHKKQAGGHGESDKEILTYARKKMFNQLLSSFMVNLLELILLSLGIIIQTKVVPQYGENINQILPTGIDLTLLIACSYISYLVSCILFSAFYSFCHPGKMFLSYYDRIQNFSLLPIVEIERETIEDKEMYSAMTDKEDHSHSNLFVQRIRNSLRKKLDMRRDVNNERKGKQSCSPSPGSGIPMLGFSSSIVWVPKVLSISEQSIGLLSL